MSIVPKIFYDEVKRKLETNNVPIRTTKHDDMVYHISFVKNGKPSGFLPIMREKRSILVIDINKYTKKDMEQQFLLVEMLKYFISKTSEYLSENYKTSWNPWYLFKSTGDGGIFVFGDTRDPGSTKDAFKYAIWLMRFIAEYNLKSTSVYQLKVRMALSYGDIYATTDYNGKDEIIGDTINNVSRLINAKEFEANAILMTEEFYEIFRINKNIFLETIKSSKLQYVSDYIVGKKIDKQNFVELMQIPNLENEGTVIKPYFVNGKIDNYLLCYN